MGDYLAERLATITTLVDKSMPIVAALFDAIPRGKGGRQRGPGKTLLLNIARGLAQRVLLTKLVELDGDVCPYLTCLDGGHPSVGGRNLGHSRRYTIHHDDIGNL